MSLECVELRIFELYRAAGGVGVPEVGELGVLWGLFDVLVG